LEPVGLELVAGLELHKLQAAGIEPGFADPLGFVAVVDTVASGAAAAAVGPGYILPDPVVVVDTDYLSVAV